MKKTIDPITKIISYEINLEELKAANPRRYARFQHDVKAIEQGNPIWRGVMIVEKYENEFLRALTEGKVLRKAFEPNCPDTKVYAEGIGANWTSNFRVASNFTNLHIWGGDELIDTNLPLTGIIFEAINPKEIDVEHSLMERLSSTQEYMISVTDSVELVRVISHNVGEVRMPKPMRFKTCYCV